MTIDAVAVDTTAQKPGFLAVFLGEPFELIKAQPHQALISTGSIALMGQFAGSSGIVDPLVGYCIAAGVEWAYFRGLASDAKAPTRWGAVLNWSACAIVVLWGMLWVAQQNGAIDERGGGWAAWLLAAAHVIPIAWLSLCSAMTHRAAMLAEAHAADQRALDAAEFARQQREEDEKLRRWEHAQRLKAELKLAEKAAHAAMQMRPASDAANALPERIHADEQICPKCGTAIPERAAWLAARRWKRCAACKSLAE